MIVVKMIVLFEKVLSGSLERFALTYSVISG